MNVRMIAHDMRTPLNALLLSLQAAKAQNANPQQLSALEVAERNAQALSAIVESLLDVTEHGAGKLHMEEIQPSHLVADAVTQVLPLAQQKNVRIQTREAANTPAIIADSNRLIRVLVNLLSNAVRFSPSGEMISVEVKERANDGHKAIIFSVSDNGPGVPAEDIDKIFLEGVSTGGSDVQTHGLGLTVCKEIVEAHRGRIWVETGHSTGATFSFSIPSNLPIEPAASA